MGKPIDGKAMANMIFKELSQKARGLSLRLKRKPGLGIILIGDNTPSIHFVKLKIQKCKHVGIDPYVIHLDPLGAHSKSSPFSSFYDSWPDFQSNNNISPYESVVNHINYLNNDPTRDGIILQLPIPYSISPNFQKHIPPTISPIYSENTDETHPTQKTSNSEWTTSPEFLSSSEVLSLTSLVHPCKDVDGLHCSNIGKSTVLGHTSYCDTFSPCTPKAVMEILQRTIQQDPTFDLEGKHIVVIGRSMLVGRPLANLLLHKEELGGSNCTITVCHSFSANIKDICKQADIIISATGEYHLIQPDWIKDDVFIIDVGFSVVQSTEMKNEQQRSKIYGDVSPMCYKKSKYYTPVPGGVGPMTIAMLLSNTVEACSRTADSIESSTNTT